jgi:hypothetical protein
LLAKYEDAKVKVETQELIVQHLNILAEFHALFQQLNDDNLVKMQQTLNDIQHKLQSLETGTQSERQFAETEIMLSIKVRQNS